MQSFKSAWVLLWKKLNEVFYFWMLNHLFRNGGPTAFQSLKDYSIFYLNTCPHSLSLFVKRLKLKYLLSTSQEQAQTRCIKFSISISSEDEEVMKYLNPPCPTCLVMLHSFLFFQSALWDGPLFPVSEVRLPVRLSGEHDVSLRNRSTLHHDKPKLPLTPFIITLCSRPSFSLSYLFHILHLTFYSSTKLWIRRSNSRRSVFIEQSSNPFCTISAHYHYLLLAADTPRSVGHTQSLLTSTDEFPCQLLHSLDQKFSRNMARSCMPTNPHIRNEAKNSLRPFRTHQTNSLRWKSGLKERTREPAQWCTSALQMHDEYVEEVFGPGGGMVG